MAGFAFQIIRSAIIVQPPYILLCIVLYNALLRGGGGGGPRPKIVCYIIVVEGYQILLNGSKNIDPSRIYPIFKIANTYNYLAAVRFTRDNLKILNFLQQDLNSVLHWSLQSNMLLHEDKFHFITHWAYLYSTLYELPHINKLFSYFTSSGITLYPTDTVKDLGVITPSDLSWSPHIGTVESRARSVTSWLISVFKTRAHPTMLYIHRW